jgi:hypothetical protein
MRKRDCKIGRTGDMVMEAKVLLIADYWLYIYSLLGQRKTDA